MVDDDDDCALLTAIVPLRAICFDGLVEKKDHEVHLILFCKAENALFRLSCGGSKRLKRVVLRSCLIRFIHRIVGDHHGYMWNRFDRKIQNMNQGHRWKQTKLFESYGPTHVQTKFFHIFQRQPTEKH